MRTQPASPETLRSFYQLQTAPWVPDALRVDAAEHPQGIDALERELRENTGAEVRFDRGSRALYATDASNYRQLPIGVVLPRSREDIVQAVAVASRFGAPLLSRGGGTSLAGQCCNAAVVVDCSKYLRSVIAIDEAARLATVEPGCVLDDLRDAASRRGLMFGPDPATHDRCTLGGMLGNNSCGVHSLLCRKHGIGLRTSDNTKELEVLTYDGLRLRVGATPEAELDAIIRPGGRRGEIYARLRALRDRYAGAIRERFPRLPRRVSGYNLDELLPENGFHVARALVGSESSCVTILEATMMLVPNPKARTLLVLGYGDVYEAADHLGEVLEHDPIGLEGIDELLFRWVQQKGDKDADLALLPPGKGWLLVEFGGDSKDDANEQARRVMERLKGADSPPSMQLYDDPRKEERIWKVREGSLGSTAWVPGHPDTWPGWEDSAVPPEQVAPYLRGLRDLMQRFGYEASLYGHFGQGCIHCRIPFDLYTADGIRHYRRFVDEAADLVLQHGGSLSGEHGDGQSRAELLPKMFGPELMQAFAEFKSIWDPRGRMNPGKVVDAYRITDNLRIGTAYDPPHVDSAFEYPSDRQQFSRAVLRCVGVGKCRRESGGTMCPSFMVTHEEQHSTRGRARLLWEMLNGELRDEGWRSEAVREALDLCLACKGCKSDCPVNVDMATYKAEFLSHYWRGRLRPRQAWAFGFVHVWAHLASRLPGMTGLADAASRTPLLSRAMKWVAGVHPDRAIPAMAPQTFQQWFRRREPRNPDGSPVLLWADTFTNHFDPAIARCAVELLEDAGFRVLVSQKDLCCGRPLYDYGFVDTARRWLRQILDELRLPIRAGLPIVVLEPSCCAVFRDELVNLMPGDEDAKRLSRQAMLLSEFLERRLPDLPLPQLQRKVLVHGHCHHKSVMGMDAEDAVLGRMHGDVQRPESGCCGMAGAFGFERGEHYDVSVACGERVLLPDVRSAADDTLILADGFSCREQIRQGSDRRALHLAEAIRLAGREEREGRAGGRPEAPLVAARERTLARARRRSLLLHGAELALLAAAAFLVWRHGADGGRGASR